MITMHKDGEEVTSTGLVFHNGKKVAVSSITSPDFFTPPKKTKQPKKMMAYALVHYLFFPMTNGRKGEADKKVCEVFGCDERSVKMARNKYFKPRMGARFLVFTEPALGIILLNEPDKIKIDGEKFSYNGTVWWWKEGDEEALIEKRSFTLEELPVLYKPQIFSRKIKGEK